MYRVDIVSRAEKDLDALPQRTYRRVYAAIVALAIEPRPMGVKKLTGSARYRIRVGDYRVIYEIEDAVLVVQVVRVDHRRNVYR